VTARIRTIAGYRLHATLTRLQLNDMPSDLTILVGERAYQLSEQDARHLGHLLREAYSSELSAMATEGMRVAWSIDLILSEGLAEPVELGWPEAQAITRAVGDVSAHRRRGLDELLEALRYLAEPP
jgi:hypothetical protein